MIKIVQRGHSTMAKTLRYSIKCYNCHTIFECDQTDTHFEMIGHGVGAFSIDCPICGKRIRDFMNQDWIVLK